MPQPSITETSDGRLVFSLRLIVPDKAPHDIPLKLKDEVAHYLHRQGCDKRTARALQAAVGELVANLAMYGAGDAAGVPVVLDGEVTVRADEVVLLIADDGIPFDPTEHEAPEIDAELIERRSGGVGLYLLRRMFSHVTYQRENGRNVGRWALDLA